MSLRLKQYFWEKLNKISIFLPHQEVPKHKVHEMKTHENRTQKSELKQKFKGVL